MAMTLGKYQLIAELGRGGMADVFLAVTRDGAAYFTKLVVVKRPKEHLASDTEFMTMLVDEARIAARLNHPNLVQTLEVGDANGQPFLTMEYLDGQSLHRILRKVKGKLPPVIYLSVLVDVLAGIHYAHELSDFDGTPLHIVHRDVTPHNVFITYEGQVKVVDFGIAKAAGRAGETRMGVIKGKAAYMAPEQACAQAIDRRVDVFAVGVMLYEALAQQRLWVGLSETEVLYRLAGGKIPTSPRAINPEVDPEVDRICQRALAPSPDERYPTALALQQDLEAYLSAQGSRPTAREIGALVAKMFADRRETTAKVIGAQLARMRSAAAGASGVQPAAEPVSSEVLTLQSNDPAVSGSDPSGPTLTRSNSGLSDISEEAEEPESEPEARAPLARWVVAAVAAVILAGATAAGTVMLLRPRSADAGTSGSSSGAPISVTLRGSPPDARFTIDDGPQLTNPYSGSYPRDGRPHKISASAPGFNSKQDTVVFSEDISMRFSLAPAK